MSSSKRKRTRHVCSWCGGAFENAFVFPPVADEFNHHSCDIAFDSAECALAHVLYALGDTPVEVIQEAMKTQLGRRVFPAMHFHDLATFPFGGIQTPESMLTQARTALTHTENDTANTEDMWHIHGRLLTSAGAMCM